jgi:hypothetical protein
MKATAAIAVTTLTLFSAPVFAQNAASNKAFFAKETEGITFAAVSGAGETGPITLISVPAALKTSSGGAVSATLSMETLLSTYNITTAIVNGGKSCSSPAAIKAWIEVDGMAMQPGAVVYNDRLQATGLTLALTCAVPLTTCTVNGQAILELYQATKSANSFTFFIGPLSPIIHSVVVKVEGLIECHDSTGTAITCPSGTLAGYTNASTLAGIGKATLMIEEEQNWGAK